MKRIFILLIAFLICASAFSGCGGEQIDPDVTFSDTLTDFPNEPPVLFVGNGESSARAWRGTCSWMVEGEDGLGHGVEFDSPHPLDCKDSLPIIGSKRKIKLTLYFEGQPTRITVKRYKIDAEGYDDFDEIKVSEGSFEAKAGDYIYEVVASWNGENYNGTVYYAFRTSRQKTEVTNEPDHTLEFRITENVDDFDFSAHQPKYGIMGGWEYYGKGYVPSLDENGQQTDPEHCVIYTITNYPDYSSNTRCVTRITITDPAVKVYGLSLLSPFEEIKSTMTAEGFAVTESAAAIRAEKDNLLFTFSKEEITVRADVTNRLGIVY